MRPSSVYGRRNGDARPAVAASRRADGKILRQTLGAALDGRRLAEDRYAAPPLVRAIRNDDEEVDDRYEDDEVDQRRDERTEVDDLAAEVKPETGAASTDRVDERLGNRADFSGWWTSRTSTALP